MKTEVFFKNVSLIRIEKFNRILNFPAQLENNKDNANCKKNNLNTVLIM